MYRIFFILWIAKSKNYHQSCLIKIYANQSCLIKIYMLSNNAHLHFSWYNNRTYHLFFHYIYFNPTLLNLINQTYTMVKLPLLLLFRFLHQDFPTPTAWNEHTLMKVDKALIMQMHYIMLENLRKTLVRMDIYLCMKWMLSVIYIRVLTFLHLQPQSARNLQCGRVSATEFVQAVHEMLSSAGINLDVEKQSLLQTTLTLQEQLKESQAALLLEQVFYLFLNSFCFIYIYVLV